MAFPHIEACEDHRRDEDEPGLGGVVRDHVERAVDVADDGDAEDEVDRANDGADGGVFHDQ